MELEDTAGKKHINQCVHCGHPVGELYKDFKKGIIKISHCSKCNQVADKYIEYDSAILLLDVLLLQKAAYRHILINSKLKGYWRLLLVLWLCDALTKLMQRKAGQSSPRLEPDHVFYSAFVIDFYEDYVISAAETLVFFCIVLGFYAAKYYKRQKSLKHFEVDPILRALTMSCIGRLLIVPTLIWGESYSTVSMAFTYLFVISSNVQALRAVTKKVSLMQTVVAVLLSYYLEAMLVTSLTDFFLHRSTPIFAFPVNTSDLLPSYLGLEAPAAYIA